MLAVSATGGSLGKGTVAAVALESVRRGRTIDSLQSGNVARRKSLERSLVVGEHDRGGVAGLIGEAKDVTGFVQGDAIQIVLVPYATGIYPNILVRVKDNVAGRGTERPVEGRADCHDLRGQGRAPGYANIAEARASPWIRPGLPSGLLPCSPTSAILILEVTAQVWKARRISSSPPACVAREVEEFQQVTVDRANGCSVCRET